MLTTGRFVTERANRSHCTKLSVSVSRACVTRSAYASDCCFSCVMKAEPIGSAIGFFVFMKNLTNAQLSYFKMESEKKGRQGRMHLSEYCATFR